MLAFGYYTCFVTDGYSKLMKSINTIKNYVQWWYTVKQKKSDITIVNKHGDKKSFIVYL